MVQSPENWKGNTDVQTRPTQKHIKITVFKKNKSKPHPANEGNPAGDTS